MRRIDYFWPRVAIQVTGSVFLFQLLNTAIGNSKQELDWLMPLSGVFFLSALGWALAVSRINALNLEMTLEKETSMKTKGTSMNKWNFRQGFRGRMILQRFVEWMDDGMEYGEWRDATVSDLQYYYDAIRAREQA